MAISKNGIPIRTLEEWQLHAPPKSANHWQDNRSAKEGARAWLEVASPGLPPGLADLLASHPDFGTVSRWTAEPEARLHFDDFGGEPSNADLLVAAKDEFGEFVIAVEAKGHEAFGETIDESLAAARKRKEKNPRSNGIVRIEQLLAAIFGSTLEHDVGLGHLRYQLLTATAGALHAASTLGCLRAVLLVHEFKSKLTDDAKHAKNAVDLQGFVTRLAHGSATDAARLFGPFSIPGSPLFESVPSLYVGKVVCDLRGKR